VYNLCQPFYASLSGIYYVASGPHFVWLRLLYFNTEVSVAPETVTLFLLLYVVVASGVWSILHIVHWNLNYCPKWFSLASLMCECMLLPYIALCIAEVGKVGWANCRMAWKWSFQKYPVLFMNHMMGCLASLSLNSGFNCLIGVERSASKLFYGWGCKEQSLLAHINIPLVLTTL